MNELIEHDSWFKLNWKWFIPILGLGIILIGIFFTSSLGGNTADITKAYSDDSLYENAVKEVQTNQKVKEALGILNPINKMAILEGFVEYSEDNKSVKTTISIKGTKGKAKMDISAYKKGESWEYQKIIIRIKNPKETIEIINN